MLEKPGSWVSHRNRQTTRRPLICLTILSHRTLCFWRSNAQNCLRQDADPGFRALSIRSGFQIWSLSSPLSRKDQLRRLLLHRPLTTPSCIRRLHGEEKASTILLLDICLLSPPRLPSDSSVNKRWPPSLTMTSMSLSTISLTTRRTMAMRKADGDPHIAKSTGL